MVFAQKHLEACTACQGRAGMGSTGFATYPVMEKEEPRRLLPEKHTTEAPKPDADKGAARTYPASVAAVGSQHERLSGLTPVQCIAPSPAERLLKHEEQSVIGDVIEHGVPHIAHMNGTHEYW
jgi:hypothetical protein